MSGELELEPVLEIAEIQGNSLGGFNKDLQDLIFLALPIGEAELEKARLWLSAIASRVTWLDEVISFKSKFSRLANNKPGVDPGSLAAVWMNIALSYGALLRLSSDSALFDPVFAGGMPAAVGRLGDPNDAAIRGHVSTWLFGGTGQVPDVVMIVAADRDVDLVSRVEEERSLFEQAGLRVIHIDEGRDLGRARTSSRCPSGREHFGFKDGVSQPGVRGRISEKPDDFLNPRLTGVGVNGTMEFAFPRRPLVCAGEFVLGYPRQSVADGRKASDAWPLGLPSNGQRTMGPAWARNGSFMVYRRLNQDVPAFNRFLQEGVEALKGKPAFSKITTDLFGAMVVGRWRSGAPLLRAVMNDNESLASTVGSNNDFDFAVEADPKDGFAPSLGDPTGKICPAAAHIRKVNPRLLPTDQGAPVATLARRILRRGIPFGEPLPIGTEADPANGERGLLFICYQASIRDQFEFLQSSWANEDAKPTAQLTGRAGNDLVIGQGLGARRERYMDLGPTPDRVYASPGVEWVYPTAGGYFFSPSRSALETILGHEGDTP
jgi:Dyp-type peroxidase family